MARLVLKQEEIDFAIKLGEHTLGLHSHRVSKFGQYGDTGKETFNDLQKLWVWLTALGQQQEVNTTGTVDLETCVTNTALSIGDAYNGGKIFHKSGLNVLICADNDLPAQYPWTPVADTAPHTDVAGTTATILTGQANTTAIVSALGAGTYAAKTCDDLSLGGYSDWYLPSQDEVNLINQLWTTLGGSPSEKWSSTQSPTGAPLPIADYAMTSAYNAVAVNNYQEAYGLKSLMKNVRPVRTATLTASGTTCTTATVTDPQYVRTAWQNDFTDDQARSLISKINTMASRHLPKLVYQKLLENRLELL